MNCPRKKRSLAVRGWTLIEVVLVLILGAALALVAAPRFLGFSAARAEGAGRQLLADIRYTQQLAMSRGAGYGLEFDTVNERYRVFRVSDGGNITHPVTGDTGVAGQDWTTGFVVNYNTDPYLKGVNLESLSLDGGNQLRFDSLGQPRNSAGNLLLAETGVVYIRYPASGGWQRQVGVTRMTGRTFLS